MYWNFYLVISGNFGNELPFLLPIFVPLTGVEPARPKAMAFKTIMYYQFHHRGKINFS